ncbi:hypothetical protein HU200_042085 [Digitaria exilis]|uniref:Uncharacterized protein n=1 Tax=Digitaria exilis TaxID=1010633 RepID=A0A835BBK7_9POAL|nr:hypothetical protein HU200_042085 [Digitaria exilis]
MSGEATAVRVIAVSRVVPSPAPAEHVRVVLSFLDAPWIATPPVQNVYLYKLSGVGDPNDEYAATVKWIKASLAAALALFVPLAGELKYVPETGDVVVDCSDPAVPFFEAEAESSRRMDIDRLAGDAAHDVEAFVSLVPRHDARVLPARVLSLQATRLRGAGLALGLSVHHAVADGRAMALFLYAWSSASRGGGGSPVTSSKLLGPPPDYTREAVARTHPSGHELARALVKKVAPNLPANYIQANSKADYFSQRSQLARRTFFVSADEVRFLKHRIERLASAAGEPKPTVSTFAALVTLGWTGMVRAKGLSEGEDAYLTFYADLRARLRPTVGASYFGNCITGCLAKANAGDLLGEAGLLHASRAVVAALREMEEAPMAMAETWVESVARLPLARVVTRVAGDTVFRVDEVGDFGFGKPCRVESVSMVHDGRIIIKGRSRPDGEVMVSVVLHPAHMEAFMAHINGGLRSRI